MKMIKTVIYILLNATIIALLLVSCSKKNDTEDRDTIYFPSISGSDWESVTPESLNWNTTNLENLYNFLSQNGTRAFIVLKNGKIVVEKYWGNNFAGTSLFSKSALWYWASAGKSLTAFLTGIAQQDGLLDIDDKTSDYLGTDWTSMASDKENLITIRHQLTMTTGLDYEVSNLESTEPSDLRYKADAGTQWYYHDAPYTLIGKVIENASGKTYNQFTDEKVETLIGMSGTWINSGYNTIYWSTARDAARFGLLMLNKGKWGDNTLLTDTSYYNKMINTSQNLNLSYGYLWWLNGKASVIFPGSPDVIQTSVTPDGPPDMYSALGKNGQFIDIVPSKNLVIVRMGETPDGSLVPVQFHNQIWQGLMTIIN